MTISVFHHAQNRPVRSRRWARTGLGVALVSAAAVASGVVVHRHRAGAEQLVDA